MSDITEATREREERDEQRQIVVMNKALVSILFAAEYGDVSKKNLTAIKNMARTAIRKTRGAIS